MSAPSYQTPNNRGTPRSSLRRSMSSPRCGPISSRCARVCDDSLRAVHPNHAAGAANLVHYVGLRRHDVRALQDRLAWIGLSSLGRAESHVLANLDKVLGLLHRLAGRSWTPLSGEEPAGIRTAAKLLDEHACALLGSGAERRSVRIMVTLGQRGGVGLRARSQHACQRDGLCPHQLCARRYVGMGRDGSQHPARARRVAAPLPYPVRSRWTQAAHRADRARTRSDQVAPAARRVRPRARTRPHPTAARTRERAGGRLLARGRAPHGSRVWQRAIASS